MKVNWNFLREGGEGGAKQKTFHGGIFSRTAQFPIKKSIKHHFLFCVGWLCFKEK